MEGDGGDAQDVEMRDINDLILQDLRILRVHHQNPNFCVEPTAIRVCKVDDPSCFYFHLESSYNLLVGLERELAEFYDENPDIKYPKENEATPKSYEFYGFYSKSKKRWVRVLRDDNHETKRGFTVVLIDYAEREVIADESMLRELPLRFCHVPAQGYKGQLFNDANGMNIKWSGNQSAKFRELVLHRHAVIQAVGRRSIDLYIPEVCGLVHAAGPNNNPIVLGGVFPYGIGDLPTKKAKIEVTRDEEKRWVKR